jgi:hypothetical protein
MATLMDKVKGAVGTKKMRAESASKADSKSKAVARAKAAGSTTPEFASVLKGSGADPMRDGVPRGAKKKGPSNRQLAGDVAKGRSAAKSDSGSSASKKSSGAFPAYKKDSEQAKSFRSAFAAASKAKKKTFVWEGRTYSTAKKK